MNMYLHELRALRKSIVIWALAMTALAAIFLLVYPGMAQDAEDFKKLLGGYPPAIRAMLDINLDTITSILGFYSFVFSFITLCGAIQGMNLGVSVLSKETRERTADFLLVKPVSRSTIVSAKLLAAFTAIIATDIIFYVLTSLIANSVKTADFSVKLFLMINLTLLFIQLIFLSLGAAISVFFRKLRSVLPLSLGVVFIFYMAGALLTGGKNEAAKRYLSPFEYFNTGYIVKNAAYEPSYLAAAAVIVAVAVVITYLVYTKKDIHAL